MKKKIVCGMLCAAMSLSLLAGCGGGSEEGGKDAKKDGDAIHTFLQYVLQSKNMQKKQMLRLNWICRMDRETSQSRMTS